jgi:hypothetical protein
MFKRILLALTFVAAFSAVGVGVTDNAEARRGWGRPYVNYYYGPPRTVYYREYAPYRTYYRSYYRPRYYDRYYDDYYYGDYYRGPRGRVAFRIGW